MATETIDAATEAVYQKAVTYWTSTPFVFKNEDEQDLYRGSVAWTRWSVVEIGSEQETLGAKGQRRYKRTCLLTVQVFTPTNSGTSQAGALTEEARALFEGEEFSELDFIDGVNILDLGPDKEKKWQQDSVRAAFVYELTK